MLQADDFVYPEQLFPSAEPFLMPLSCLLKQGVPAVENILVIAEMDGAGRQKVKPGMQMLVVLPVHKFNDEALGILDGGKDFPFHGFRYFSLPNISEVFLKNQERRGFGKRLLLAGEFRLQFRDLVLVLLYAHHVAVAGILAGPFLRRWS
jgi:hypothetical protein